ncbi:hypothetical protein ACIQGT_36495 [Streptomyces sp. NPDC093108]|uniref:hypothetical protein n=1 Tax=Streptomyces sp. NPDC093108 TaxID=3366030 RepID=UPI00380C3143
MCRRTLLAVAGSAVPVSRLASVDDALAVTPAPTTAGTPLDVETTGLKDQARAAAYAALLCTTSYTAARAGDRGHALAMIEEAERAARRHRLNGRRGH